MSTRINKNNNNNNNNYINKRHMLLGQSLQSSSRQEDRILNSHYSVFPGSRSSQERSSCVSGAHVCVCTVCLNVCMFICTCNMIYVVLSRTMAGYESIQTDVVMNL